MVLKMNKTAGKTIKPATQPRSSIPSDVLANLERACQSGKWLFAVWRVENGKVFLDRTASNFNPSDIDQSMRMIVEDVQKLKGN